MSEFLICCIMGKKNNIIIIFGCIPLRSRESYHYINVGSD